MESDSTLQMRRKPLVMCGNENIVLGLLVFARGEREVMDIHTENAMGKRKGKKKTRNEMQNGDDGEA